MGLRVNCDKKVGDCRVARPNEYKERQILPILTVLS